MKIMPDLTEVKKIASEANYNVLPVSLEMLSDFTTPIETMRILKNVSTHCYMLESAQIDSIFRTKKSAAFAGSSAISEIVFRKSACAHAAARSASPSAF